VGCVGMLVVQHSLACLVTNSCKVYFANSLWTIHGTGVTISPWQVVKLWKKFKFWTFQSSRYDITCTISPDVHPHRHCYELFPHWHTIWCASEGRTDCKVLRHTKLCAMACRYAVSHHAVDLCCPTWARFIGLRQSSGKIFFSTDLLYLLYFGTTQVPYLLNQFLHQECTKTRHFELKNRKIFLGGGTALSPNPSPSGVGDTPPHTPSTLVPSAPRSSRVRHMTLWPANPERLDSTAVDLTVCY